MKQNFEVVAQPGATLVPNFRDKNGDRYDIFSLLLNDRTILVGEGVDSGLAASVIAQIKLLEKDPTKPITFIVNSPGGSISDGLAIYDAMRSSPCQITTIGLGIQASMGSVIFVAGDRRILADHGEPLVHEGSGGTGRAVPTELEIGRAHHERVVDSLKTVYQDHTGLTKEFWGMVLKRDTWFTAQQALEIGFAHEILSIPASKKAPYAEDRATSPVDQLQDIRNEVVDKLKAAIAANGGDKLKGLVEVLNNNDLGVDRYKIEGVGRVRGELALALSKFPQFQTAKKQAEILAKAKPANTNQAVLKNG